MLTQLQLVDTYICCNSIGWLRAVYWHPGKRPVDVHTEDAQQAVAIGHVHQSVHGSWPASINICYCGRLKWRTIVLLLPCSLSCLQWYFATGKLLCLTVAEAICTSMEQPLGHWVIVVQRASWACYWQQLAGWWWCCPQQCNT